MAVLLNEIQWGKPLVPSVSDPAWEAAVKKETGGVPDYLRRVAPVPWLRRACLDWGEYPLKAMPVRLADIGFLVTAQENACRYCYGAARAHMRIVGFSERQISAIERQAQMAELDPQERLFIDYCRHLARSSPRPARKERDSLMEAGFSRLAVAEIAFFITNHCFHNRVATFIASPPELMFERVGRSMFARFLKPILAKANRRTAPVAYENGSTVSVAYQPIVDALAGLPAAPLFARTMNEAFASPVLSKRIKALMFAVIARQLDCGDCVGEAKRLTLEEGLCEAEFDACLATLSSPRLDAPEAKLLEWARETIRYQPHIIQKRTEPLVAELGPEAMLEAVGVASLANATIRLAALL